VEVGVGPRAGAERRPGGPGHGRTRVASTTGAGRAGAAGSIARRRPADAAPTSR